jgi:uncharacterized protein (DUF58 family)
VIFSIPLKAIAGNAVGGHLVQILDPAEETLPYEGRAEFLAPEGGERWVTDRTETLRDLYRAKLLAHREAISLAARNIGWTFLVHHTDRSPAEPLLSLMLRLQGDAGNYRHGVDASADAGRTA